MTLQDPSGNPLLSSIPPWVHMGMEVFEEPPPPPTVQLSKDFKWCSDDFRAQTNVWLVERFGFRHPILENKFLVSEKYGFIVTPPGMRGVLANVGV